MQLVKSNRLSIYYSFEDTVRNHSDAQAIWSRQGAYTWRETYVQVCQYAAYFLQSGVRPGDLVAFYLQNSPEFCFAWIGLLAIGNVRLTPRTGLPPLISHAGCAPAMINFNLSGDALVHCLRISGAAILLADEDSDCKSRIDEEEDKIKNELHVRIVPLSEDMKKEIGKGEALRIGDEYRNNVCGDTPIALLYTRYIHLHQSLNCDFIYTTLGSSSNLLHLKPDKIISLTITPVVRQDSRRRLHSLQPERTTWQRSTDSS